MLGHIDSKDKHKLIQLHTLRRRYFLQLISIWMIIIASIGITTLHFARAYTVYTIPSSIASDCSRDVSLDIVAWIKTVPDTSEIRFVKDGCYRVESSLAIFGRNNLKIDGQNATFKSDTDGSSVPPLQAPYDFKWPRQRAHWFLKGSTNIELTNFKVDGPNALAGPTNSAYFPQFEEQAGVMIVGSNNVRVTNCSIKETYGDFIEVIGASKTVYVSGCNLDGAGRQGIAIVDGSDILIEHNTIGNVGRSLLDLEPPVSSWHVDNVVFQNNNVGRANGVFVASLGDGPNVNNITIKGNTLQGLALNITASTQIRANDTANQGLRKKNWNIVDNSSDTSVGTPIAPIHFERVDNIDIQGNYQKVSGYITGPSGVIYSGVAVWLVDINSIYIHNNVFPVLVTPGKNNNQLSLTRVSGVVGMVTCNNILTVDGKPPAVDGVCKQVTTPTGSSSSSGSSQSSDNKTPGTVSGGSSTQLQDNGIAQTTQSSQSKPSEIITKTQVSIPKKYQWNYIAAGALILIGAGIGLSILVRKYHHVNLRYHLESYAPTAI